MLRLCAALLIAIAICYGDREYYFAIGLMVRLPQAIKPRLTQAACEDAILTGVMHHQSHGECCIVYKQTKQRY